MSGPLPTGRIAEHVDPDAALAEIQRIYRHQVDYLAARFAAFCAGDVAAGERVSVGYPYVQISVGRRARVDTRSAYGFAPGPGTYRTTLTRPDLFAAYYREQLVLLLQSHGEPLEIGVSGTPVPIHFAGDLERDLQTSLSVELLDGLGDRFDLPNLAAMDDRIVNNTLETLPGEAAPLALFTAPRVDFSLARLLHYTGTAAEHFQGFVLYTNYQFYVDQFVRFGLGLMAPGAAPPAGGEPYTAFIEPGNRITPNRNLDAGAAPSGARAERLPQMPAYHLTRVDGKGITLINIGVGPSNAKNITDHVAVLRPHAWLMLGHCAGLRNTQRLGDYVLAHGYAREDHVLDEDLPTWIPLPALAEVQIALEKAVSEVTGLSGYDLKQVMRTGTVATVDDRNWELRDYRDPERRLRQSRAVALDMESGTIAANGFRFRVPYGTLLCVSDKPLHGQLKLPGMANSFYRRQVEQHLAIGIRALELLRETSPQQLHSRKLRSFFEVAFR